MVDERSDLFGPDLAGVGCQPLVLHRGGQGSSAAAGTPWPPDRGWLPSQRCRVTPERARSGWWRGRASPKVGRIRRSSRSRYGSTVRGAMRPSVHPPPGCLPGLDGLPEPLGGAPRIDDDATNLGRLDLAAEGLRGRSSLEVPLDGSTVDPVPDVIPPLALVGPTPVDRRRVSPRRGGARKALPRQRQRRLR